MKKLRSIEELAALRERVRASRDPRRPRIIVCGGTGCRSNGSLGVAGALRQALRERGLERDVDLKMSGCHGFCQEGPVVVVDPDEVFYRRVGWEDPGRDAREIVASTIVRGEPVERLLYESPLTGEKITRYGDIPFYAKQMRVALRNNGKIDPNSIEDFIEADGYAALARVLTMEPEEVMDRISRSGLRGRGGGGFPTGRKWSFCRNATDRSMRYIICNADEGDPGAFMDRSIMEGDPHSVLEGMAIGAYAISRGICAAEGYIYIRAEYPLAVTNVRRAMADAEALGLLGDNILGTDFSFHIRVKEGAGAFVCGEETGLIASIEGRRGMPRTRPPFPAQSGLHGKPSNINNVETWVTVPRIINDGPEWYASIGTKTSAGTKVFSLVGKIVSSGLVEVPMGTPLQEIVFDIGGGVPNGKRIKAVQTGGPSGGCIPAGMLDIPVDYEKLTEAGSIMGSGGMVVMDEDTCMVDIARYFVEFTQSESCGKCAPCRLGTRQMHGILENICAGRGKEGDVELLQEIGEAVHLGALCGLGQTAPNPVLTTIRHFRDEYEAHIKRKKCPAAVCREMVGAPCKHTCPAGVDVPRYVRFIAAGRYADALDVVRESMPLPAVCGLVCFHPCEAKCRRGELDDPIAIRALKRFAAERGVRRRKKRTRRAVPTGKRVAVVGSGPAGLSGAYYLGLLGHKVTVFEQQSEPGGMLRAGIPSFRLPREVIDAEIAEIKRSAGVRIRTNSRVSSVDKLLKRGYDAVLLATGAWQGMKMGIPGEDTPQALDCVTFLREVSGGVTVPLGRRVAIIGGGNAAMDGARTALRQGAQEVTILYRRRREDMPAADEEIEEALEEGIRIELLTTPVRIRQEDGRMVLECVRMRPGPVDGSGRPRPVPIEGSEFETCVDCAIMAIGQMPEEMPGLGCEFDSRGRARVDEMSLQSGRPGVFAAGDVVTGPASVVEAIAAGRQAAESVDRYLGGRGVIQEVLAPTEEPLPGGMLEEQEERPRVQVPKRSAEERLTKGDLVEMCYAEEAAVAEAGRCLRCDLEELEE